jgi:hypothetical protein
MLVLKRLSTWAAVATKSPCDQLLEWKSAHQHVSTLQFKFGHYFYFLASYVGLGYDVNGAV